MLFRFFRIAMCLSVLCWLPACAKTDRAALQAELREKNPEWAGEFNAGSYEMELPVFEFGDEKEINAVALSGPGLKDLSPLESLNLSVLSLDKLGIRNLDFLRRFHWNSKVFFSLKDCPNISSFQGMSAVPFTSVSIENTPFSDTSVFRGCLRSLFLTKTAVSRLELQEPEHISEFLYIASAVREPDLRQISKMTNLTGLCLGHVDNIGDISFSGLKFLSSFSLIGSRAKTFPVLEPDMLSTVWIEDCPDLESLRNLSGKVMDRLCIIRSGDPGVLLKEMTNTRVNLLVINGADVSNVSFLKRIKNLKLVRFQNCTGLPEQFKEPYVEIIVENL